MKNNLEVRNLVERKIHGRYAVFRQIKTTDLVKYCLEMV